MMIDDMALRDMLDEGRRQKRAGELYEREVRRRTRERRIKALRDIAGALAFFALAAAVVWLCCVVSGYHWE